MADTVNLENNKEQFGGQILDGLTLKAMFAFATDWFAKSEPEVNALNVFPVPDGDTGTNMLLTMRSSLEDVQNLNESSVSKIVSSMARGALMGARGNSGVILSQIWRGLAQSFRGVESITGKDLAAALQNASRMAYEGMENPVEGTMLTVIKEMAAAASRHLDRDGDDIIDVLQTAVEAAKSAVANTPNLLPVLKEAGVVDSGGQGLYILFEGALMYLKGRTGELEFSKSTIITGAIGIGDSPKLDAIKDEVPFGYCTEFLIKGENFVPENIRLALKEMGQSLIVTGDGSTVKVHIHCLDPGPVIHYAVSLGTLSAINIRNMDEQFADMLKIQQDKRTQTAGISIVTIATGEGIIDVFNRLGASAVIPGGPTMNPSAKQILLAVEAVPSNQVIILPNDKNLILAAQKIETLTAKKVCVVPTVTIPQGIAALLAFNPEAELQTNVDLMSESKSLVKTIEVTRAIRSTRVNGFMVQEGQPIGLLDGKLAAVRDSIYDVVKDILDQINLAEAENSSIFFGADIEKSEAEQIREMMCRKNNRLNVEVVNGGQPLYHYIISVE